MSAAHLAKVRLHRRALARAAHDRDEAIVVARGSGETVEAVATAAGLKRRRVQEITAAARADQEGQA